MTDAPPPAEWYVPVLNVLNHRAGELIVQASIGRVVLVPPPGTGHIVPTQSLPLLRDGLNVAEAVANLQAARLPRTLPHMAISTDGQRVTQHVALLLGILSEDHINHLIALIPAETRRLLAAALASEEG